MTKRTFLHEADIVIRSCENSLCHGCSAWLTKNLLQFLMENHLRLKGRFYTRRISIELPVKILFVIVNEKFVGLFNGDHPRLEEHFCAKRTSIRLR